MGVGKNQLISTPSISSAPLKLRILEKRHALSFASSRFVNYPGLPLYVVINQENWLRQMEFVLLLIRFLYYRLTTC